MEELRTLDDAQICIEEESREHGIMSLQRLVCGVDLGRIRITRSNLGLEIRVSDTYSVAHLSGPQTHSR